MTTKRSSLLAALVAGILVTSAFPADAAPAEGPTVRRKAPKTQVTAPVEGTEAVPERPTGSRKTDRSVDPVNARWQQRGSATIHADGTEHGWERAGKLPVWVRAPQGQSSRDDAGASDFSVRMHGPELTDRLGLTGAVIEVTAEASATGKAPGDSVGLRVAYRDLSGAVGGDWSSRLRLVRLPACALSTPQLARCRRAEPLETVNRTSTRTLSTDSLSLTSSTSEATAVVAMSADADGPSGDWAATSLAPSGKWTAGGQGGDFSWGYPLRTPPVAGGLAPELALGYSSGSVDGRETSTNNQPSWVGEGFDLAPGFIERSYRACAEDMAGDANNDTKTGDLCWNGERLAMSFGQWSGELVRKGTSDEWRLREDDGTRIERLTSGGFNEDEKGEYWRVTTPDGTQYYFGKGASAAGAPATHSAWTVPVFGNHPGEPCHAATFAASHCERVWRWNLDHVADPHDNATTYFYASEKNHYGRNLDQASAEYVRGGYLKRIEYGERAGTESTKSAPARVLFTVTERCIPSGQITCAPSELTKGNASHWPDVPFDQICTSSETCPDQFSPTFFTRKRLTTITTQTRNAADSGYQGVDKWKLEHSFPDPGDGTSAALWLKSVQHTGLAGGSVALPKVAFTGQDMENRVDGIDNAPPLRKFRIIGVDSESGSSLMVRYSQRECTPTNLPAKATNGKRCFPVYFTPDGAVDPELHWFHKYVVDSVTEQDRSGASTQDVVTDYTYVGNPAWAYDDTPGLLDKYRTWGQWRGYEKVRTTTGTAGDGPRTQAETLYYRGMDGDRAAGGGKRSVSVTDSRGVATVDHWRRQGAVREEVTYDGPGGPTVSSHVTSYQQVTTATAGSGRRGLRLEVASEDTRTPVEDGGYDRTTATYTYDGHGFVTSTDDFARSVSQNGTVSGRDRTCSRTTYTHNTNAWILGAVASSETVSVGCDATPSRPGDVVDASRTYYDGHTSLTAAPNPGDVTREDVLDHYADGAPVYQTVATSTYDSSGRVSSSTDALGRKTTTSYTPASGGAPRSMTETSPDPDGSGPKERQETVTELDPRHGQPTKLTQPNGTVTELAYDALGRRTKVWLPGRDRATESANTSYTYTIKANGPNAVTTEALLPSGDYRTQVELFDGLLRSRQVQTQASGGGRVITDTTYDSKGQVVKERGPVYNTDDPSNQVLLVSDGAMPSQTRHTYDGAGRETASIFEELGVEQWRTTTTYGGDRTHVDPPKGGTASTVITDARGQMIEQREYVGTSPTGDYLSTRYTHTPAGELETVTDDGGNTWSYDYDLRGQRVATDDPDAGRSTQAYDAAGQLVAATDANGKTLAYSYDGLGRRTELRDESKTGALRATWTYDSAAIGYPDSATRYHGGVDAYTETVRGYDDGNRPTGTRTTVKAVPDLIPDELAGTYEHMLDYFEDGSVRASGWSPAWPLAPENMLHTYDDVGRPVSLGGSGGSYVANTVYSPYGEVLQLSMGNTDGYASWHTLAYDEGTRRLETARIDRQNVATTDDAISYSYDAVGNVTRVSADAADGTKDTQCFDYDNLRQLTEAWTPASSDCADTRAADTLGGPSPYWTSWSYDDATGNRLTQTHRTPGNSVTSRSAYQEQGVTAPHAVTSVTHTHDTESTTDAFSYDAGGNTTARPGQELIWSAEGNLTEVKASSDGATIAEMAYSADGRRIIRDTGTATTLYLPNGTELTWNKEQQKKEALRYYTHAGVTVAVREGNAAADVTTLMSDAQGTASYAVTNTTGQLTRRRTVPFGGTRGNEPSWPGDRGFVGGTKDDVTGLTQIGARPYDPELGRFIAVDPLMDPGDAQQVNGYAYANNNPATYSDPSGLMLIAGSYGSSGTSSTGGSTNRHRSRYRRNDPSNFKPSPTARPQPLSLMDLLEPGYTVGAAGGPGTKADLARPWGVESRPLWGYLWPTDARDKAESVAIGGHLLGLEQAADMMDHWLSNTGDDFELDVRQMRKELPDFDYTVDDYLQKQKGKRFNSGWQRTNTGNQNRDWYFAVNNFQYRVSGGSSGGKQWYWLQVYKRYNYGTVEEGRRDLYLPNKDMTIMHIHQPEFARLHTLGLARDYDAVGSDFFYE